ncbi:MAG: hypothetical protein CFE43_00905 [Burkholderiales bacterium PBB3]|nr:MAG: hypothetical protein CFE43_00905 [Burkholderiales bacterium PBB3]
MNALVHPPMQSLRQYLARGVAALVVLAALCGVAPRAQAAVVPQVAANSYTSMALDDNGKLWGWGDNSSGLLGRPSKVYAPLQVKRDITYVRAFSGRSRNFLLDSKGMLWGVGNNQYGQLGDGSFFLRRNGLVKVGDGYTDLAAGGYHTLAIKSDGSVWSWGANEYGQLGDGAFAARKRAFSLSLGKATSVAAGTNHSLAVLSDGSLWAWGINEYGQLGDASNANRSTPVAIGSGYVQVAAGNDFSLARKSDGSVWAWGRNTSGQLGDGGTLARNVPTKLPGSFTFKWVGASSFAGLAIDANNTLYYWGLVNAGAGFKPSTPVVLATGVASVAAGETHFLIKKLDGSLVAQGANTLGQLGIDDPDVNYSLAPVLVNLSVSAFAAAGDHSIAVTSDGHGVAWGDNSEGQLAQGRDDRLSTPVELADDITSFSLEGRVAFAINKNGVLFGWGDNSTGRLGVLSKREQPKLVRIGTGYASVSSGNTQTFAIKTDGSLWGWGENDFGQLGLGDTENRPVPVKIGDNYKAVAAGASHTLGLKTDGSLWAWGRNHYGQLGNGLFEVRFGQQSNPTPIKVGDGFTAILAGAHHSVGMRADGTVWVWGWNDYGQVGDGSVLSRSSPVLIKSNVAKLLSAQISTVVLGKDGVTYAWGYNGEARRRYNVLLAGVDQNNVLLPTVVAGGFLGASVGSGHALYLRNDGLITSVGYQQFGQLGDGSFEGARRVRGQVLAGEFTGLLDLLPTVPNVLNKGDEPAVLLRTYLQGSQSQISLGLEARIPPLRTNTGSAGSANAGNAGKHRASASTGYNLYVVAGSPVPGSSSFVWFTLQPAVQYPDPTWGALGFPVQAYLENLSTDAESVVIIDVLTNSDLSGFPGATLYIGYGITADEMVASGRFRPFYSVPTD